MHRSVIPTCYFPSTVYFVDDSRDFLLNFTLQLNDLIAFQLHDSPYKALDKLSKLKQPSSNLCKRCFQDYLDASGCPITNHTVNLDISSLHWEIYNPKRFNEVSVVVADYAMPGMNGLEFCKQLENNPIKRILLTGKADEKTAVQAFNEGIIDLFIQKQNINITKLINESILSMQHQYFQSMADIIIQMISVSSPSCLKDMEFSRIFYELVKHHQIVEYYLVEDSGSFLMLDADANLYFLLVKTEADLKMFYDLAKDNNAKQETLNHLEHGHKIPFCWRSNSNYEIDFQEWSKQLVAAHTFKGEQTYYYAFLSQPEFLDIKKEDILSYNQFLDHMNLDFSE